MSRKKPRGCRRAKVFIVVVFLTLVAHSGVSSTAIQDPDHAAGKQIDRDMLLAQVEEEWSLAWRREAYNRHAMIVLDFLTWIAAFILLALTGVQVSAFSKRPAPMWFRVLLACISLLAVTLPQLSVLCRFRQKQEVNDLLAREYGILRTKILSHAISLEQAVLQYEDLTRSSPEALSRETP